MIPKSPKIHPAPTSAQSRTFIKHHTILESPPIALLQSEFPQTQFRTDCLKLVPALTLAGVADFPAYLAAPLAAPLYREFDIKESLSSPPLRDQGPTRPFRPEIYSQIESRGDV